MRNLNEAAKQDKYFTSIIIFSHRLSGLERGKYIMRVAEVNPLLAAKCIMSCESNVDVELGIAAVAELAARNYQDAEISANGFLALLELNNFGIFKNILISLDHDVLKHITSILKRLVNSIDADKILMIVDSIVNIQNVRKGVKPKLMLDIMKLVIMSNIDFSKSHMNKLMLLYGKIDDTMKLSQVALFLKQDKKHVFDFFTSKGVKLSEGENPEVPYKFLVYFVGQSEIVDKDKMSFGNNVYNTDLVISVSRAIMENALDVIERNFKIGDIIRKDLIIKMLKPDLESSRSKFINSLISGLKQLNVISYDRLEIDDEGINRAFYKIISYPKLDEVSFKEEIKAPIGKNSVVSREIRHTAFVSKSSKSSSKNNRKELYLNEDESKNMSKDKSKYKNKKGNSGHVSDLGEKLLKALTEKRNR